MFYFISQLNIPKNIENKLKIEILPFSHQIS